MIAQNVLIDELNLTREVHDVVCRNGYKIGWVFYKPIISSLPLSYNKHKDDGICAVCLAEGESVWREANHKQNLLLKQINHVKD